jgi:pimeloyl-ACP methyl ester carboxylesterase
MTQPPSLAVIAGAGSAGLTWEPAARLLPMTVLPVPDAPSVAEMAAALAPQVAALPEPRVLTGYALGAMVAVEVEKLVAVQALVLVSAGFGIKVGESVLEWVTTAPSNLFERTAQVSLAKGSPDELTALAVRDFEARGQPVLLHHLTALAAYRPSPPEDPPPTLVIWGDKDRSVPFADHLELAVQYRAVLAPVSGAAHKPYLEQPAATIAWIRRAAGWAAT